MEDMLSKLNKTVDDNIGQCLKSVSTHVDVAIRQSYGRCVLRSLQQPIDLLARDVCTLISTLLITSEDEEATVRSSLLAELPDIILKCQEISTDDFDIHGRYLDVMLKFLEDAEAQLRKNAFYAVKHLLEKSVLERSQVLEKVCPAIIGLSNLPFKNNDVDCYTNAIELMALLSTIIGPGDTEKYLLDRFCDLCENEVYSIRRWCADYMPVFCHVLCQTITENRMLPIFKLLCEDSVWGVRRSAAKSLPKIALICSLERRWDTLAPIAFNLLNDSARFVSVSAFKNLGQFISTFAQPCCVELEYESSGKLYMTSKANDTKSQNSFTEDNSPTSYPREESIFWLKSVENPFRKFLAGGTFSIPILMNSPVDLSKKIADDYECEYPKLFTKLIPDDPDKADNTFYDDDDDLPSSSGCSSASSTGDGDDSANGDSDNLQGANNYGSGSENNDLNKNKTIEELEQEFVDDFIDNFPNDILNKYSEDLRGLLVQIRETTNADIRQRNKEARITTYLTADENSIRRNADIRARMFGGPVLLPPVSNPYGMRKPIPWKLQKKTPSNLQSKRDATKEPESDSNILVIDNTHVTLRKKGTSQINADDESIASRMEDQPPTESKSLNESDYDENDLKEFNTHNYWYICPSSIDIEKELFLLDLLPQQQPQEMSLKERKLFPRLFDLSENSLANDATDSAHKIKLDKLKENCVGPTGDPATSFFNQSIVPPYLIEYFVSMEHFADSDFNMYCVYNFPAVVLTLTKENWHLTYDLLLFLAGDIQWKVRKTIAMFICEIATIIGRERTHTDLMPIFLGFFKDLDEVKIEALKNLPTFLNAIDINHHARVITNLGECWQCDNDSNWRFREELARQLLHLIKTYGTVYRDDHMIWVTGMAITLLSDKVSAVRLIAMDAIAEKCCTSTPIELNFLLEFFVEDFARHAHWRRRQTFVNICQELITKYNSPSFEVFEATFLPHILELANDAIPNIRLAVVRLLALLLSHNPHLHSMSDHNIMQTITSLQDDVDNDVKFLANSI